jgi:endonuclease/exonuclease/phosphatase family metal-dependent hydrolase
MTIKIITLNLWRYYKWKNRKNKIINFIKKENPDIVFLQEVVYDEKYKKLYKNQIEELNKKLFFKAHIYSKITKLKKWHKIPLKRKMTIGLGILSKFPIKKIKTKKLKFYSKYGDTKKHGIQHVIVSSPLGKIDLINVHFSNNDESAKLHLEETINWCNKNSIKPIIAGDFNIKITKDLIEKTKKEYFISYLIKPYKSFLPTKFSHNNKPITLDYILAHKKKFIIEKIQCKRTNISDHKPIISIIKQKTKQP